MEDLLPFTKVREFLLEEAGRWARSSRRWTNTAAGTSIRRAAAACHRYQAAALVPTTRSKRPSSKTPHELCCRTVTRDDHRVSLTGPLSSGVLSAYNSARTIVRDAIYAGCTEAGWAFLEGLQI